MRNKIFRKKVSIILSFVIAIVTFFSTQFQLVSAATMDSYQSDFTLNNTVQFGVDSTGNSFNWKVVDVTNGIATLQSSDIMPAKQYSASNSNQWSTSDMATYLNGTFYNAVFNANEQAAIQNYALTATNGRVNENFVNKVVLPSVEEVGAYKLDTNTGAYWTRSPRELQTLIDATTGEKTAIDSSITSMKSNLTTAQSAQYDALVASFGDAETVVSAVLADLNNAKTAKTSADAKNYADAALSKVQNLQKYTENGLTATFSNFANFPYNFSQVFNTANGVVNAQYLDSYYSQQVRDFCVGGGCTTSTAGLFRLSWQPGLDVPPGSKPPAFGDAYKIGTMVGANNYTLLTVADSYANIAYAYAYDTKDAGQQSTDGTNIANTANAYMHASGNMLTVDANYYNDVFKRNTTGAYGVNYQPVKSFPSVKSDASTTATGKANIAYKNEKNGIDAMTRTFNAGANLMANAVAYVDGKGNIINISNDVNPAGIAEKSMGFTPMIRVKISSLNVPGAGVVIKKTDKLTGDLLSGAKFTISDSSGNAVSTVTTGTDGTATLSTGLISGEIYSVAETASPLGYNLDPTAQTFTNSDVVANLTFADDKIINFGSIKVTKTDADTKALLSGAVFHVFDSSNNLAGTMTTDTTGTATLSQLPVGSYTLSEKTAPTGYDINSTVFKADVTNGATTDIGVSDTKSVAPVGSIRITKTDSASGVVLQNAIFKVTDASNNIIGTITTGVNGIGILDNITPGTYIIIETTPPAGYYVSGEVDGVVVKNGNVTDVAITDVKTTNGGGNGGGGVIPTPVKPVPPVTPDVVPPVTPDVVPVPVVPTPSTVTPSSESSTPAVQPTSNPVPTVTTATVVSNGTVYKTVKVSDTLYEIFDANGTPLGYVKIPAGKTIDDIDINGALITYGSLKINPKTGDNYSNGIIWLFLIVSIASLTCILKRRKSMN